MTTFAFRFHPLYRALAAPFGITPTTSFVRVVGGRLEVRFGPWLLTTPVANIAGFQATGPYSVPKTAGPPHLSLADRGMTCATNPEAGGCITFVEPVQGIDPLGMIRHPGVTVTVDRIEDLERAVTGRVAPDGPEIRSDDVTAGSPWGEVARWVSLLAGALTAVRRLASLRRRRRARSRRRLLG